MHVLTVLGYVKVGKTLGGWWEVQRAEYRAASTSLPRALWLIGFQTPEARAIAGTIFRNSNGDAAAPIRGAV